jgi:hypothetical protein
LRRSDAEAAADSAISGRTGSPRTIVTPTGSASCRASSRCATIQRWIAVAVDATPHSSIVTPRIQPIVPAFSAVASIDAPYHAATSVPPATSTIRSRGKRIVAAIWSPGTVFKFLVNASGALIVFVYMAIAASQVSLRRARERAGGPAPALLMWLFPWASYLAIAAMGAVLVAMALTPAHREELYASALSVVVALLAFVVFRRGKAAPDS